MPVPEIAVAANFVALVAEDTKLNCSDRDVLRMAVAILRELSEAEEENEDD